MSEALRFSLGTRILLITSGIVVVIAGMRTFSEILSVVFMAALIAIICAPLQSRLSARGWSQGMSTTLVLVLVIGVGILFLVFLAISTQQVIDKLPDYQDQLQKLETNVSAELAKLGLEDQAVNAVKSLDWKAVISSATSAIRAILGSISNIVLFFLTLFYMIVDAPNIPKRLRAVLGGESQGIARAGAFIKSVQRYMILKTVFGIIIASIQTVFMSLMGVDFAVQWGVLAVITNYIPNVGFILGLIPPALVTLLEMGAGPATLLIVVYSLINNVIENFITPKFMGEELDISSLFIYLSLILWTFVLGAPGALLSVPLTLLVKIMLLEGDEGSKGLVALISEGSRRAPTS